VIEAPDELRDQETACPNCDATNLLRAPEDVTAALEREEVARAAERTRFLGQLDRVPPSGSRPAVAPARDPLIGLDGASARGLSIQAARRLQDISVYLLGFAYMFLILSLVLALMVVVGTDMTLTWKGVAVVGSAFVGLLAYIFLKFASDAVRALADATELLRSVEHRVAWLAEKNATAEARVRAGD
jgi:hypothetical protein